MSSPSSAAEASPQASATDQIIVTELPKFDLDTYISNYSGRTRFDRLLLIGKTCLPLRLEALKAAINEAKSGSDVSQYMLAWDCLRKIAPHDPDAHQDQVWVESTERCNKIETQRLESELKGYKNNLIKESIRMGNEDLGRHFEAIGKLNEASEAYTRMRLDVSSPKHNMDCSLHLTNVSLYRRDWNMVVTGLSRVTEGRPSQEISVFQTLTRFAAAIACINLGSYLNAAEHLLSVDFAIAPAHYAHMATPNDIAIYGSLTALATMDRDHLQRRVLDNQFFRTFLELEPHIRKAVSFFVSGRYSNCLSILEAYRTDYLLDIYLQNNLVDIYSRIREKCIIQYVAPFSRIKLDSLQAAFGVTDQPLEHELIAMISNQSLDARIDARNRLLVAVQRDPRAEMQNSALEAAREYGKLATEQLRRVSILSAGLEVVAPKRDVGSPGGTGETWFEDPRPLAALEGAVLEDV